MYTNLKIALGAARAQTVPPSYLLGGEPANTPAEEAWFPQLATARHLDARAARTGQAAVRLAAQTRPAALTSARLPVRQGQRLTFEVYAHYTGQAARPWLRPAARVLASSFAVGTLPAPSLAGSDQPVSSSRRFAPYAGFSLALTVPHLFRRLRKTPPLAYVQCNFYDRSGAFVGSNQQLVTATARGAWQQLRLSATVPADGSAQLVLGNAAHADVWFDDLQVQFDAPASGKATRTNDGQAQTNDGPGPGFPGGPGPYELPEVPVESDPNPPSYPGGDGGYPGGGGPPTTPDQPYTPPDSGGGGAPSSPNPPITKAEIIVGECAGLQKALGAQADNNKEVAGYATSDGKIILLPMDQNTSTGIKTSFPLYDSDNHLVTNGPFEENGVWKIDMNDWTNGHQVAEYDISYFFHTHPIGTASDGTTYDSNNPSPDDYANAAKFPGMANHIVNKDNEVDYDPTHVISTSKNHCP